MKNYLLAIFVLSIASAIGVFSQNIPDKYSKFFTQNEFEQLIFNSLKDKLHENGTNQFNDSIINEHILPILYKIAFPEIIKGFKSLDSQYKNELKKLNSTRELNSNSSIYQDIKSNYIKYIKETTSELINSHPNFTKYKNKNYTDRITKYHSSIKLNRDGTLIIEETIRIFNGDGEDGILTLADGSQVKLRNTNNEIKRGIIRAFPTLYKYKNGFIKKVPFDVISVKRNNETESWKLEDFENGKLLYIGSEYYQIESGFHTYSILYKTDYQVGYFNDYDELLWNVTGNGWTFLIGDASSRVVLPQNAKIIQIYCFTGKQGSLVSDCRSVAESDSSIVYFSANVLLKENEGFTVGIKFNKGHIDYPNTFDNTIRFLFDNIIFSYSTLMLLCITLFNLIFWFKYGKDPKKGVIAVEFAPPQNLSPTEIGYISESAFNHRFVAATLVDAAVHKLINISVRQVGSIFKSIEYSIEKGKQSKNANHELFRDDVTRLIGETIATNSHNKKLEEFANDIKSFLEEKYLRDNIKKNSKKAIFSRNDIYLLPGIAIIIISFIILLILNSLGTSDFLIIYSIAAFIVSIIIQSVFGKIMKAYTPEGRIMADKIEGFKRYLKMAEKESMNLLNPPEKSLEHYEEYLPFAIALGVENEWGKKFKSILEQSVSNGQSEGWYSLDSTLSASIAGSISSNLSSSFSGTIASASAPPGSSDSGGGGGSGSGGGGGGGSGW